MNIYEFADSFLQPYKIKGEEIIPKHCPICNGGKSKDRDSFALNVVKHTYNCKRGTCGASGTFSQLCKMNGVRADITHEIKIQKKTYQLPELKETPPSEKAMQYMKLRGFTQPNIEMWNIKSDEQGNIVFPFYRNGKLVYVKYRKPYKVQKGDNKTWQAPGCEPVFWGMDNCIPELPLVITEGEFDAMACTESGVANVVSIPAGVNNLECIDTCWDWLEQFREIIIWGDNDVAGREFVDEITHRLGIYRCSIVQCPHKDANESMHKEGQEKVREYVKNAKIIPIAGIIRLSDVKPLNIQSVEAIKSDHEGINRILAGYRMGEVSLWTGINSSGKSTFLGQEYISSIDQGYKVCVFSGELPASVFKYWLDLQCAGIDNVVEYYDNTKQSLRYFVSEEVRTKIQEWYKDSFFLYDNMGSLKGVDILEVFGYVARRYGVKRFAIDNLMMVGYEGNDRDYYRKQVEFVDSVKKFAVRNNVHVDIVGHPKKTSGRLNMADIKGEGSISDLVDNILAVHRIQEEDRKEEIDYHKKDTIVEVLKNRFEGTKNVETLFKFDQRAKRFWVNSPDFSYGWERNEIE